MKVNSNNILKGEAQATTPFFNKQNRQAPFFQRKGSIETVDEEEKLMKKSAGETQSANIASNDITSAITKKAGNGQPLQSTEKSRMESAFGTGFDEVNIHTDTEAAAMSENLNAHAFTYGQDIYFNSGKYRPGTLEGDVLLAHELAHTVQQKGSVRQMGNANDSLLEQDADEAAMVTVREIQNMGSEKNRIRTKQKSGLRISRCSKGPMNATRKTTAIASFRSNNTALTTAEQDKIIRAIGITGAGNLNLEITFFEKYASNSITKDPSVVGHELAFTDPSGNMRVNPTALATSYSDTSLGNLLVHELVHTRHGTNFMGANDYLEGEAYATEYFFAERTGDTARVGAILAIVSSGSLTIPFQRPALLAIFRKTYATLKIIYQVIDTGTTPHPTSPLAGVSAAHARELATEFISVSERSRSAELTAIIVWADANKTTIGIPPI